jgi:hypothetical protein
MIGPPSSSFTSNAITARIGLIAIKMQTLAKMSKSRFMKKLLATTAFHDSRFQKLQAVHRKRPTGVCIDPNRSMTSWFNC